MLRRPTLAFAAVLALFCGTAMAQLPQGGRPLPDVPIQTSATSSLDLKQYRGKSLVIGLISTVCQHCVTAIQTLRELQTKYGTSGLQVVAAVGDPIPISDIGIFAAQQKANFPVGFLNQPEFIKLAALKPGQRPFVPIVLFVDRKGMVRVQYFGDDQIMKQDVRAAITLTTEHLLKDAAAATASAKK